MTVYDLDSEPSGQALLPGSRLEEFIIERVLGSGGFGITYLARDTSLGRKVVIKENLPAQFAWRETTTGTVRPRHTSGGDVDDFAWSMNNFLREAETLALIDHPGIVPVLRKFEANGTAYFVMPFVEGMDFDALIESRRKRGEMFSEAELGGLLSRVLDTLGYLHDRGIYHRDIKPANILITNEGIPTLIDFGSARQRLSERSMTVVESAGYTPFEQLQSRGNVGPWSDLYALGGTVCKALTGAAPPKANDRIRRDPHVPLAQRAELTSQFSAGFLRAIDKATVMDEEARWQNAREWLTVLWGTSDELVMPSAPPPPPTRPQLASEDRTPPPAFRPKPRQVMGARAGLSSLHTPSPQKYTGSLCWIIGILAACIIIGLLAWKMRAAKYDYEAKVSRVEQAKTASQPRETEQRAAPTKPEEQKTCVNLKKFHNASLDKTWHPKTNVSGEDDNDLAALGKGRKELAGTEFELSGLIQLLGAHARGWGGKFPESVTGIPVDAPVKTLQFLHGCGWQAPDGTMIGKYVVHFQDDSTLDIPIVYGVDVRDWWFWKTEPKGTDRSVIAWTGENAATKTAGMSLRIYKSSWTNPDPMKRVVSLDFVSSMAGPAPFLIAITAN